MDYRKFENTYIVRIDRGEEIISSLTEFAKSESLKLASISGIGAVDYVKAGLYNVEEKKYKVNTFRGEFEMLSLIGTITEKDGVPYLHLHISISDEEGRSFGGHLNEAVISGTCELTITCQNGNVGRKYDEETGLNIFDF